MAKIAVAMSGGVDSSVAALLLQRAGHTVHGIFMKNYEPPPNSNQPCPWEADQADVAAVCEHLGIPWESWNFEQEYKQRVLEYFFREYEAGRTPNPDVMCNREVKFGVFFTRAKAEGFEAIATGHYARIRESKGLHHLLAGRDANKDQSYFLHALGQDTLAATYFPVGEYEKPAVRALAQEAGLPTATKPDSQGICFIGQVDVAEFLRGHISTVGGPIVTADGEYVGEHHGLPYYTIGQRHGLGVGGGVPYYVAEKNVNTNTLIVARGDRDPVLYASGLVASQSTWVLGTPPSKNFTCQARIRYRQPLEECAVELTSTGVQVQFKNPQRAITPGQAIVFYSGEECLGGATIEVAAAHSL